MNAEVRPIQQPVANPLRRERNRSSLVVRRSHSQSLRWCASNTLATIAPKNAGSKVDVGKARRLAAHPSTGNRRSQARPELELPQSALLIGALLHVLVRPVEEADLLGTFGGARAAVVATAHRSGTE